MIGRCFVAMAFGRKDKDRVFTRFIKPVLRGAKMTAVRVDQKEHNRNINEVIMEELKTADLVIADLTYARPSVYFEAGYAERATSVIYTVRADHFRPTVDDEQGNLRVHFDVSMRNVITWSSENDSRFAKRLAQRVRHVAKAFEKRRDAAAKQLASRLAYSAQPTADRIRRLARVAGDELRKAGLARPPKDDIPGTNNGALAAAVRGIHDKQNVRTIAMVWIAPSFKLTSVRLATLHTLALRRRESEAPRARTRSQVNEHTIVIASESAVNIARVRSEFPHAHLGAHPNVLEWQTDYDNNHTDSKKRPGAVVDKYRLFVLDKVQSEAEFRARLSEVLVHRMQPRAATR